MISLGYFAFLMGGIGVFWGIVSGYSKKIAFGLWVIVVAWMITLILRNPGSSGSIDWIRFLVGAVSFGFGTVSGYSGFKNAFG